MPPAALSKTISAIVERSGAVRVPLEGTLALVPGDDGRYRVDEKLIEGIGDVGRGWKARCIDGRRLPAGRVLTREEAERAVRTLMGLDCRACRSPDPGLPSA
jgi:hypothetical protein